MTVINDKKITAPTAMSGISYFIPPSDAMLLGRDGKVTIPYGDLPIPLLEEDFKALVEPYPDYDVVGRGIYHALRVNPDCAYGERYAHILKDAYPHFFSELASHIIMLDKKDVDVGYIDRKINYLKILALIEPDNPQLPLEIGVAYLDRGLRFSALYGTTVTLYRAEKYLKRALELDPDSVATRNHLGEVSYLLGKYDHASALWCAILPDLKEEDSAQVVRRLDDLEKGDTPAIPVVDYLEILAVAFERFQTDDCEESVALIQDVLADRSFRETFPMPEIHYVLGRCFEKMEMPKYAEEAYEQALQINPAHEESREALLELRG